MATAALSTTRFSQLPSPPSPADQSSTLQQSSLLRSHYRPFSAFYSSLPPHFHELGPPASNHKPKSNLSRHRSHSALHALSSTMGIGNKDAKRNKALDGNYGVQSTTQTNAQALRAAGILIDSAEPHPSLQRPNRSRLLKKRSLASLLSSDTPRSPASQFYSPEPPRTPPLSSPRVVTPNPDDLVILDISRTSSTPTCIEEEDDNFVCKDMFLQRSGMLLHPYPTEAVYMQGYNPVQLDCDYYAHILLRRLNPHGTPSFHDYGKTPPATVLDIGCGQGHWILEASKAWQQSYITGFDLVDVTLPALDERNNVAFVTGNFLKYHLPFPDNYFEMVRMANLTLCIPSDKWDFVLAEVKRILAPSGRLELIDDQLTFPYHDTSAPITVDDPDLTIRQRDLRTKDSFNDDFWADDATLEGGDDEDCEDSSTVFDSASSSTSSRGKRQRTESPSPILQPPRMQPSLSRKKSFLSRLSPASPLSDASTPTQAAYPSIASSAYSISRTNSGESQRGPTHKRTSSTASTDEDTPWETLASTCRDMEAIFEAMLEKKYGIHPQPSEFILDTMKSLFGKPTTHKLHSFHLNLAPDSSASSLPNYGSDTLSISPTSLKSPKPSLESPPIDTEVGFLSIPRRPATPTTPSSTQSISKKAWKHLGGTKKSKTEPLPPSSRGGAVKQSGRVSAKAADRLGITYTQLAVATANPKVSSKGAGFTRKQSPTPSPPTPSSPKKVPTFHATVLTMQPGKESQKQCIQSTGMVLLPSTFIPMPPMELEMHASKHMHMLLGCKVALAEYIASFCDEADDFLDLGDKEATPVPVVKDDEFASALWRYECFRRRRFHWPSHFPESDLSAKASPGHRSPASPAILSPAATRLHHTPLNSPHPGYSTKSSMEYDSGHSQWSGNNHENLTHLRTIRVFEAVKHGPTPSR